MKRRRKKLSKYYKTEILRSIFSMSQKDIENINVENLKKGDRLFVESTNPNDPRLLISTANDIYFEQGYASTAIFLFWMVEYGKNYLRKDSYLYPALFCVRMYLEIKMKQILKNCTLDCKDGHDLSKIWEKVKANLDTRDEETEAVEQLVLEIQTFDPAATTFRYPKTLNDIYKSEKAKGNEYLSKLIDIQILRKRFLQLYKFLDGIHGLSMANTENNQ